MFSLPQGREAARLRGPETAWRTTTFYKIACVGHGCRTKPRPAPSSSAFHEGGANAAGIGRLHSNAPGPWLEDEMTAVGFEPTHFTLVELESTPLDHSGKLSLGWKGPGNKLAPGTYFTVVSHSAALVELTSAPMIWKSSSPRTVFSSEPSMKCRA